MLGAISNGFSHNTMMSEPDNALAFLPALSTPVSQLRQKMRFVSSKDGPTHTNSVRRSWESQKNSKFNTLTLQEEAGRNGSIFTKIKKDAG